MPDSARTRQVVIVLAVLLPAVCLSLLGLAQERARVARLSERHARELARMMALTQESTIEQARDLLVVLSRTAAVRSRNASACSRTFADAIRASSRFADIGLLAADGTVIARGLPDAGPTSLADRPHVRRAVQTRCFSIGEYKAGQPSLEVALPLVDGVGNVEGALFGSIDLSRLDEAMMRVGFPSGSAVMLLDPAGTVVAWIPECEDVEGRPLDGPLARAIRESAEGAVKAEGPDGVTRWFGFAPIAVEGAAAASRIAVGIPNTVAEAGLDRSLRFAVGGLAVIGLVGIVLALAWGRG